MLRFPLQLIADLTRARISQKLRGHSNSAPILFIRPMEQENPPAADPREISPDKEMGTGLLARVRKNSAPVIWIGGLEPLLHPEMGQLTRCIAGHGQHVFLQTNGALLRRRIHEFRPAPRLFLTVQLDGLEQSHNLRAGRADAFQLALEGLRAAHLSGFLICAHTRIDLRTTLAEISELLRFAETLDLDGFLITQAVLSPGAQASDRVALQQKTLEARQLLRNRWWESFSRLVETSLNSEHYKVQSAAAAARRAAQQSTPGEESVHVA